jgi:hypothetical protein
MRPLFVEVGQLGKAMNLPGKLTPVNRNGTTKLATTITTTNPITKKMLIFLLCKVVEYGR